MLAFAEREFVLIERQTDGSTTRDHLRKQWKSTGEMPELLATAPPLPQGAAHVWHWFCEARGECLQGSRITGQILQSLEWALGVKMALWERAAIRALESLFWQVKQRDDRS